MADSGLAVRTMTRPELDLAVAWAAAEGWNPGLSDAECFFAADPRGFFVGVLDGAPVGCISAVKYGAGFGFVGFYIVRPELRGRGHGIAIWNAAMASLGARNVGLDGVVAQQDNYRKSGFTLAYRNIRYGGEGIAPPAPEPAAGRIVPASAVAFETLLAYDTALFPAPRPAFLRPWLAQPGALALALLRDGRLAGYGMLRPCPAGFKFGPLFADDDAGAEALFRALAPHAKGRLLFLDTPEVNPRAVALAERYAMKPVFETARMYTGRAPDIDLAKVFGVTSFELG